MRYLLFLLCFILLCAEELNAQSPQQQAAMKLLHDMPGKIRGGTATDADMSDCRTLYNAVPDENVKRRLLVYAAQYQRLIKKNPVRSLEILLPQLLDADTLKKWKPDNAEAKTKLMLSINDAAAMSALEIAQALFALEKTEFATEIVDDIGKKYTDETRAFAAEAAGDFYKTLGDYQRSVQCYELGVAVLNGVKSKDYFFVKSGVSHAKEEIDLLWNRLPESKKIAEEKGKLPKDVKTAAVSRINIGEWKGAPPKVERLDIQARFIICMISDGAGGAFVGTEDYGIYHYDNKGNVKQYTTKDGLGDDNAYALAVDKSGRLWAGNLNSGVSVFNGETWKNYDVVDGPIGERIFDIQVCPTDGDVWMATSAGLTRYKVDADEWEHFTREDGLLEDQCSSLAFKDDGTLIVGTQCHGLAVFNRNKDGNYKHAKNITAPERYGPGNCSPVPLVPFGDGLPTNQINQILAASDGVIWIATPTGLVKSDKNLVKMQYVRGKDYADKVRGLYGGVPKEWKECPKDVMEQLLPEDYITCLAEGENGTIWLGTRQRGFMAVDPKTGRRGTGDSASMGMADNYVSAILPTADSMPLFGLYIGGVIKPKSELKLQTKSKTKKGQTVYAVAVKDFPKLPSPVKPPTVEELKEMQTQLEKLNKPLPNVYAAYYGEDWKTQGDWLGRTTKNWAIMCAGVSPLDREVLMCKDYYGVESFIGPNAAKDDTIRRWCHWIKTDNPNSLWDPLNGYRRQAEWDDHGEAYPIAMDGPDLWYLLEIRHNGMFRLGMYFFNKDGHEGHNRLRDYMLEIYPAKSPWEGNPFYNWKKYSLLAEKTVWTQPPLAKSRMKDFWGGVYKQFLLPGEGYYFVKIDRNYSFNTILSAVIVERLQGEPTHEESIGVPFVSPYLPVGNQYHRPPMPPKNYETEEGWRIGRFWKTLDEVYRFQNGMAVQRRNRIAAYQTAAALSPENAEVSQAATAFRRQLNLWDERQRKEWREAMETAFKTFYDSNESLRKSIEEQKKGPPQIFLDRHKWQK